MLVKHYPTLLAGVGRCLISVGLCWMLECSNESNTIQQYLISVPGTILWRIYMAQLKLWDDVGWKVWTKSKHYPTCLMCCSSGSNMLRSTMFDQHVWSFWTGLKDRILEHSLVLSLPAYVKTIAWYYDSRSQSPAITY